MAFEYYGNDSTQRVLGEILDPPNDVIASYQTLSPVRRTFVFLGSRCTQPLTPRNAHALRYEFSKWRTGQRGKLKKQSDFAMNSQHTPSLERRIHGRKIQNCMILRSI